MRDWMGESLALPNAEYAVCSSGGKDSLLALDRAVRAGLRVTRLVTLYDGASERVRFHAVPIAVMRAQAAALSLPLDLYPTTPADFERVFLGALADLRASGIGGMVFGNIHLADVRAWYEERVRAAGLAHVEPLWGAPPDALVREVLARGYTAVLTCVEEPRADPAWLGQPLSEQLLAEFLRCGIDCCGERGEYHTLVTAGPLFHRPLPVRWGATRVQDGLAPQRFRQIDAQLDEPEQENTNMPDELTTVSVARAFTEAWTSRQFDVAASHIADDVVFDGPLGHVEGKAAYVESLERLANNLGVTGVRVLAALGDATQALIMYELLTERYGNLTCAKLLTVRDGAIHKDLLTFDSYAVRKP